MKRYDFTINGYYGFDSLGDDSILSAILTMIASRLPGAKVAVICQKAPAILLPEGLSVSFIQRKSIFKIILSLFKSRVFISGGGSLLQDQTSKRSLFFYSSLIKAAKLCACRICLYSNGIGPLSNEKKARLSLALADMITVRDPASLALAKRIAPEKEIILSADPVFFLDHSAFYQKKKMKAFAVSLRECKGARAIDTEILRDVILKKASEGLTPVYVPLQESYDMELCQKMQRLTGGVIAIASDEKELCSLLSSMEFTIGMRLHFLLFSAAVHTPCVPLSYDQKVRSAMDYLGIDGTLDVFDLSRDELLSSIKRAQSSGKSAAIKKKLSHFQALASRDGDMLAELCLSYEKKKEREKAEQVSH